LNYQTFQLLSNEEKDRLVKLLPICMCRGACLVLTFSPCAGDRTTEPGIEAVLGAEIFYCTAANLYAILPPDVILPDLLASAAGSNIWLKASSKSLP
jgi:hypothetical protein